jgi:hypothetical protein
MARGPPCLRGSATPGHIERREGQTFSDGAEATRPGLQRNPAAHPFWTLCQSALRPFASHRCTRTTQKLSNVL